MFTILPQGLHILDHTIAGGASHDSAERYVQPQCHPDTRKRILDVLYRWACGIEPTKNWAAEETGNDFSCSDDSGPSSSILWLHGPAGSGKSAIAQSLCQKLKEEGRLGGSFFLKRSYQSRGNASKLFPTLAYQLALSLPELNHSISHVVGTDLAIAYRSLATQLQKLIIEPCRRSNLVQPMVIVIDGLDECEDHNIQQEILCSIANTMHQSPLPILFFIASRPESHIRESFEVVLNGLHRALDVRQSFSDVRKYREGVVSLSAVRSSTRRVCG
jgi:GTPase SAR1 family protein